MSNKIQIDKELFLNLCKYFLICPESQELFDACKSGIASKYETALNRELYNKMHDINLSPSKREAARQEYLDRKGIPQDFRWSSKYDNSR